MTVGKLEGVRDALGGASFSRGSMRCTRMSRRCICGRSTLDGVGCALGRAGFPRGNRRCTSGSRYARGSRR